MCCFTHGFDLLRARRRLGVDMQARGAHLAHLGCGNGAREFGLWGVLEFRVQGSSD